MSKVWIQIVVQDYFFSLFNQTLLSLSNYRGNFYLELDLEIVKILILCKYAMCQTHVEV